MTFVSGDYDKLVGYLFENRSVERAAYLLCAVSTSDQETRLLVREVFTAKGEDIISESSQHIEIQPESFMRIMKRASDEGFAFVFVHSHPEGFVNHSAADDLTEAALFKTAYTRIAGASSHASLIFSSPVMPRGRIWLDDGTTVPIRVVRSIGQRCRFFYSDSGNADLSFFDRQIRAFGPDIQALLRELHIGIVGAGGTGSAVAEQLIRLGVGTISIFDEQTLDSTNVSRVYGSRVGDAGIAKVELIKRLAHDIGLNTVINSFEGNITIEANAKALRNCDVLFGCTDDEWGRSILCKISVGYLIPLFDMGIKIDSESGLIKSVEGRVTTVAPGTSCLLCRGRITTDVILSEVATSCSPENANSLRREGYLPELPTPAPAVIAFTTAVAAAAVSEFLHRLTGFMGSDRASSETILFFDKSRIRTNGGIANSNCFCQASSEIGIGDQYPFLGSIWPG